MSAELAAPFDEWLVRARALELGSDPLANMLVFHVQEAMTKGADANAFVRFVEATYREYCRHAARARMRGWFYAWVDEMSGTLRCSFCDAPTVSELPCACRLRVVDDAAAIGDEVMSTPYADGIPMGEILDGEPAREQPVAAASFELTVFARPALSIAPCADDE